LKGGTTQVLENHDVVLACNASGEPPPVIAWVGFCIEIQKNFIA